MKIKKLHIVFPKEYMEILLQELKKYESYTVEGTDYRFDTFYDFAMSNQELNCDIALIVGDMQGDIPVEEKVNEFLKKMTDICFKRPQLKFIISLPTSYKHIKLIQQTLVSLSIYNVYFTDQIQFDTLINWIENPQTLADMKEFILPPKQQEQSFEKENPATSDEKQGETKKAEKEDNRINKRMKRSFVKDRPSETKVIEKIVEISPKNIGVISISKGAGSTFHASNFSSFLSKSGLNVGLYESPFIEKGRTYLLDLFDLSGLVDSTAHMIYEDYPISNENSVKYKDLYLYPVNYKKGKLECFTTDMMYKYLNVGRHTFKIADLGYYELNDDTNRFLQAFDHIYAIVDLSPMAFIPNFERFQWLKKLKGQTGAPSVDFILNPYVSSVPKQELKELELTKAYRCESFERELIMKAYFNKDPLFEGVEEIQEELNNLYNAMSEELNIPLKQSDSRKKIGFFNKIFNKTSLHHP